MRRRVAPMTRASGSCPTILASTSITEGAALGAVKRCLQSRGRLLADEHREAREAEGACDVVDHVDLAGVETGLQRGRGDRELEDGGIARAGARVGDLDERRLVAARAAAEERDRREHLDVAARRLGR